jgi:hypothetical protein
MARGAIGEGVGALSGELKDLYIDYLKTISPVIESANGKDLIIKLQRGFDLKLYKGEKR